MLSLCRGFLLLAGTTCWCRGKWLALQNASSKCYCSLKRLCSLKRCLTLPACQSPPSAPPHPPRSNPPLQMCTSHHDHPNQRSCCDQLCGRCTDLGLTCADSDATSAGCCGSWPAGVEATDVTHVSWLAEVKPTNIRILQDSWCWSVCDLLAAAVRPCTMIDVSHLLMGTP